MRKLPLASVVYLLVVFVLTLTYLPVNDLHPDEALYWAWSTRPQAGYFDNAPLIAFVIRLSTMLGGRNEFAVRLPAALSLLFVDLLLYLLAMRAFRKRTTALIAVFLFTTMPMALVGSHIITCDAPLMVFAALTWFFVYEALVEQRQWCWYLAGLTLGLALLAKYHAILIGLSVFLLLLLRPDFRVQLKRKEPYLAALLAFLFFLPVLCWNAKHNWVSFLFQSRHGIQAGAGIRLSNLLAFLAGQMGVVTPTFFLVLLYQAGKRLTSRSPLTPAEAVLTAGFLPTLVFFSLTSLTYAALPNWPLIAYFTASLFVAVRLERFAAQETRTRLATAIFLGLTLATSWPLVIYARYPGLLARLGVRLPPAAYRINELYGWRTLGRALDEVIAREFGRAGRVPVFAERYGTCAEIMFYTAHPVEVFASPSQRKGGRANQFDLWTLARIEDYAGRTGLLVTEGEVNAAETEPYYDGIGYLRNVVIVRDAWIIRRFTIYRVTGIKADPILRAIRHKDLGYTGSTHRDGRP